MDDLISRQAAIEAITRERNCTEKLDDYTGLDIAIAILESEDELPTIDPVKHGKWIVIPKRCENQTFDECKCSVCGTVEYFNSGWKKFSYCPNCGAKMEQEDEDER